MSRFLLTWELGLNLGHLTRLLPVAERLKADGHTVLVATRDIQAAATVLGAAGIPFVQAPHLPLGIPLAHRATGYADILLSQGWSDRAALWGLTQGWLNLFRMFRPDKLVLDYSPTVTLAARIAKIPCVLVGNGFELPPTTDPLPPFPGFSWATPAKAAQSERLAVANANGVLAAYDSPQIAALRTLVVDHTCLFVTFPELDHYRSRTEARYIGPLYGHIAVQRVDWPDGNGPKIFACLRPDTNRVSEILSALVAMKAQIICVATGFATAQLDPYRRDHIRFALVPVELASVINANLCVTYGAEGTTMRFLLAGVPALISAWHVETFMAGRRIESGGLGVALTRLPTERTARDVIERLASDTAIHNRVAGFSREADRFNADRAVLESTRAVGLSYGDQEWSALATKGRAEPGDTATEEYSSARMADEALNSSVLVAGSGNDTILSGLSYWRSPLNGVTAPL